MTPYIFTVGHMNYARYMTWNLRNVDSLPTAAKNDLMKGTHNIIVTQTTGWECRPTDSENKHTPDEEIAVWVGSLSVCANLDLVIETMYCHEYAGEKPFSGFQTL